MIGNNFSFHFFLIKFVNFHQRNIALSSILITQEHYNKNLSYPHSNSNFYSFRKFAFCSLPPILVPFASNNLNWHIFFRLSLPEMSYQTMKFVKIIHVCFVVVVNSYHIEKCQHSCFVNSIYKCTFPFWGYHTMDSMNIIWHWTLEHFLHQIYYPLHALVSGINYLILIYLSVIFSASFISSNVMY